MKFFGLIIYLALNVSLIAPCFSEEVPASDRIENTEGDTVLILDDQITSEQLPQNSSWQSKAQEILINAMSLTGIKYKYGGNNPDTGFDCSGFVRYVFSHAVNLTLPPTARAISQIGITVKKDELQPGDLVFFNTLKSAFSHVGIYIGNNKFIHAPSSGGGVRIENMQTSYWTKRYNGAQRLEQEASRSN